MPARIRKLIETDREDINEISRHVWDGNDYLPAVAEEWLKDPKCHFFGVEIDGHIVAVGNLRLIEDGQIGWMEGLRVHPEFRGKGFANEITRHLVTEAERLGVRCLRYTTADENIASLKLAKMAGFSRLLTMTVLWIINPTTFPQIRGYPAMEETSPAETYRLLKTNPDIIPHEILIFDWKALNNKLQNLKEIGRNHHFYIALKDGKVDSVSLADGRSEPNQEWWSFTAYAGDAQSLAAQLSNNMVMALERGFKSITCTFETKFEKTLSSLDFESEEQGMTHLVLLEKQIQPQKPQRFRHRT